MEEKLLFELRDTLLNEAKKAKWEEYSVDANLTLEFISNSPQDHARFQFDLAIQKAGRIHAVMEVKNKGDYSKVNDTDLIKNSFRLFESVGIDIYVITDGIRSNIIKKNGEIQELNSISRLAEILFEIPTESDISETITEISQAFKKFAIKHKLSNNNELNEQINNDFEDQIEYNSDLGAFRFKGDPSCLDSHENKFFLSLLPKFVDDVVYRYTTLDALFSMIKFNSFRMNGIAGMNDTTEVNYAEEYLNKVSVKIDFFDDDKCQEINREYISSCVMKEKNDDLTMWRLYGDESKGVSLEFAVDEENQNAHILIKPVSYGQARGRHDELNLIQSINKLILTKINASFVFLTFDVWKHFFKPFDYKVEKEVRLLYVANNDDPKPFQSDWVKTYGDQIFNPCVDFRLNASDFPLCLTKIILGPNSPNKEVNLSQLKEWIRQEDLKKDHNIAHVAVELSKIDHYRKT